MSEQQTAGLTVSEQETDAVAVSSDEEFWEIAAKHENGD